MEEGNECHWFLSRMEDDYFIQYTGPEPSTHFRADLSGRNVFGIADMLL